MLAVCLKTLVQQHLRNLCQMHGWTPVLCGCTVNKTDNIKPAVLYDITLTAVQKHYALKDRRILEKNILFHKQ